MEREVGRHLWISHFRACSAICVRGRAHPCREPLMLLVPARLREVAGAASQRVLAGGGPSQAYQRPCRATDPNVVLRKLASACRRPGNGSKPAVAGTLVPDGPRADFP
jgi:hypothetical protein